ncbi:MAG: hypothetical protein R6V32_12345 [Bacteroidales bacterium]
MTLEKLVLKAAKNKSFHDHLLLHYVDRENAMEKLYDEAISDIIKLSYKGYKGRSDELREANRLAACHKRINEFGKTTKNRVLELDLTMNLLIEPFEKPAHNMFGTCFTKYDYRVSLLLKKAISLLKNLHKDYRIEYAPTINGYLKIYHDKSGYSSGAYDLPDKI